MKRFLTLLLLAIMVSARGQSEPLTAFYSPDTLIGFKDSRGNIKIAPRFGGFTSASRLDKIAAVMDMRDHNFDTFYLLRDGREVARDSVYMVDLTFDCENEGYIRFTGKDGNVGLLDANGKAVVPADYNIISRVVNGVAAALKGAEKDYWDKHDHDGCNHFSWKDGSWCLINTRNEILIEKFNGNLRLDYSTLQVSDTPSADPVRVSFKGVNGKYYSFIDHEKQFRQYMDKLRKDPEQITVDAFQKIFVTTKLATSEIASKSYLGKHMKDISASLKSIPENPETNMTFDLWLPVPDEAVSRFSRYMDNCGEPMLHRYPIVWLWAKKERNGEVISQDNFYFIKDNGSYRLLALSLVQK